MKDGYCGELAVNVAGAGRQIRLVSSAVINRDLVALAVQLGDDVRTNEIGATDDENPHLISPAELL
jgi:hypothetical protein